MSYKIQNGKLVKNGTTSEILVLHMPGEKPLRTANEIKLTLAYAGEQFSSILPHPGLIQSMIDGWQEVFDDVPGNLAADVRRDPRKSSRTLLLEMFKKGQHLVSTHGVERQGSALMAAGLIWLIFGNTNPMIDIIRGGGFTDVGYFVTDLGGGHQNWRLMMSGHNSNGSGPALHLTGAA